MDLVLRLELQGNQLCSEVLELGKYYEKTFLKSSC